MDRKRQRVQARGCADPGVCLAGAILVVPHATNPAITPHPNTHQWDSSAGPLMLATRAGLRHIEPFTLVNKHPRTLRFDVASESGRKTAFRTRIREELEKCRKPVVLLEFHSFDRKTTDREIVRLDLAADVVLIDIARARASPVTRSLARFLRSMLDIGVEIQEGRTAECNILVDAREHFVPAIYVSVDERIARLRVIEIGRCIASWMERIQLNYTVDLL